MNRRNFLKRSCQSAATLFLPFCFKPCTKKEQKPNILFIMSDDHSVNAISCYGSWLSEIAKTPNIDRIAREGMRLNNVFCTNSICTPSRATILTGQYSHKNGVRTLDEALNPNHENVAKILQRSGYETAVIGKWHLHSKPTGFDYSNVLTAMLGQGTYFDPEMEENGKVRKKYKGYATDVITDLTLDWLKKRKSKKPFFLMCHHKAPHGLWEFAPRHKDLYKDQEVPEPPTFWEDKSHRSPSSRGFGSDLYKLGLRMAKGSAGKEWPTGRLDISGMTKNEIKKAAYQKYIKDYLRCVAAIDENIGRILDYLDESGLTENTVIFYTSDQGQFLGEHDYYDKRWMYEESIRMPLLVRYPKEIKPGSVNDNIILNTDFAPTFLDYAEIKTPDFMQGCSFRSILAGNPPRHWRKSMYYRYWMHMAHHNVPAHYGIRTERYKLIFFYGLGLGLVGENTSETMDKEKPVLSQFAPTPPGWELYDLEKDPLETHNVYRDPHYAEVVKKLKKELLRLKKELGDTDEQYPELMEVRKKYWNA